MAHSSNVPQPSTPSPGYGPGNPAPVAAKKKRRIFPWFFLVVQAIFLIWIITGASSSGSTTAKSCANLTGQALQTCQDASHAGTAIGVGLIIGLWVAVDVILALIYLFVRLLRRR